MESKGKYLTMNKTKIICSIGPASKDAEVFRKLIENGLAVARLNLSHENNEVRKKMFDMIKEVREEMNEPIAILADTRGPEIRTKEFVDGKVELVAGSEVRLCTGDFDGTADKFCVTYPTLYKEVKEGTTILLDDGLLDIKVKKIEGKEIVCQVVNGGILKNRKGINIPGVNVDLPILTPEDERDIIFSINEGIDYLAASFIRSKEDVLTVRTFLDANEGENVHIISKIESQTAVDNLDDIIEVSDGIMVARGDLGVELPARDIPRIQKEMIKKCNAAGKPVIVATQMLESMINNPRPTRAEVSDIANAIYDGTDAIMLSAESAAGKYPVEAVRTMKEIAIASEENNRFESIYKNRAKEGQSVTNAVSYASVGTAKNINASAIICPTYSGKTARLISMFRPSVPIVAPTINPIAQRQLNMLWGVKPVILENESSTDLLYYKATEKVKEIGLAKSGDKVVITAGLPLNTKGSTNNMTVSIVR